MSKIISPLPAIKQYCLDCVGGSRSEVKLCPATDCALYAFRLGTNPFRKKREFSDEALQRLRDNASKMNKEGAEGG